MFKGVVRISVAPYFGVETIDGREDEKDIAIGEERWGWRCIARGAVRGGA